VLNSKGQAFWRLPAATAFPSAEMDGDGFDPCAAGFVNEYDYGMPSLDQRRQIRAILRAGGIPQFSIFNGYIEGFGWQDIAKAAWKEMHILSEKAD